MTQELADRLIKHYEDSVEAIRGMDSATIAILYLAERECHYGICHCAFSVFKTAIYLDDWVNEIYEARTDLYWSTPPSECSTIPEIIASLQSRIDRLKTFKS